MDRNCKKIDLAKRIIACQKTEPFPVIFLTKANTSQ